MHWNVRLFELARGASASAKPREVEGFRVRATRADDARAEITKKLAEEGRKIRVFSALTAGGFAVITYPPDRPKYPKRWREIRRRALTRSP